jgi:hypothetical protein
MNPIVYAPTAAAARATRIDIQLIRPTPATSKE